MRIISGEKRGMNLYSPTASGTRPTEDRIKEAIFDTLFQIRPGAKVLDVFAGSGAIGLEFLSRGAGFCVFSEYQRENIRTIRKNLKKAGYTDRAELMQGDYRKNLQNIARTGTKFDYIFIDPPYEELDMYPQAINLIGKLGLLVEDGLLIVESKYIVDMDHFKDFRLIKVKEYGKKHQVYYLENRIDE